MQFLDQQAAGGVSCSVMLDPLTAGAAKEKPAKGLAGAASDTPEKGFAGVSAAAVAAGTMVLAARPPAPPRRTRTVLRCALVAASTGFQSPIGSCDRGAADQGSMMIVPCG